MYALLVDKNNGHLSSCIVHTCVSQHVGSRIHFQMRTIINRRATFSTQTSNIFPQIVISGYHNIKYSQKFPPKVDQSQTVVTIQSIKTVQYLGRPCHTLQHHRRPQHQMGQTSEDALLRNCLDSPC